METRSSAQLALATSPGEEVRAETALQVVPGPGGKESHLLELMLSIRCYLQEYSYNVTSITLLTASKLPRLKRQLL